VALDYQTLQAISAREPSGVTPYCPECGRPWLDPAPEPPRRSSPLPWQAALLGVVGPLLAISFGLRAWSMRGIVARDPTLLRETVACIAATSEPTFCADVSGSNGADQSPGTRRELLRDLLAATSGVVMVLVGIGALIRPRVRIGGHRRALFAVLGIWAMGETAIVFVCLLIVALYADLVIVRLSMGLPLTWESLGWAADEVSALFYIVTGI
jgi:hypothetical protein